MPTSTFYKGPPGLVQVATWQVWEMGSVQIGLYCHLEMPELVHTLKPGWWRDSNLYKNCLVCVCSTHPRADPTSHRSKLSMVPHDKICITVSLSLLLLHADSRVGKPAPSSLLNSFSATRANHNNDSRFKSLMKIPFQWIPRGQLLTQSQTQHWKSYKLSCPLEKLHRPLWYDFLCILFWCIT